MHSRVKARLLAGVAAVALATLVHAKDATADGLPDEYRFGAAKPGQWSVTLQGGYNFGGARTNDLTFAEAFTGTSASSATPFGASLKRGWNGRLGAAYQFTDRWSGKFLYTGLRAHGRGATPRSLSHTTNTNGTTNTFGNVNTVLGARTANGGLVTGTGAVVKTRLRADLFDFQAGYDVGLGPQMGATLLGGLRIARFDQHTDVSIFGEEGETDTSLATRNSRFFGVGPTLGAKVAMALGSTGPTSGFGIEGGVLGGLLYGTQTTTIRHQFGDGTPDERLLDQQVDKRHLAESVEADAALTYAFGLGASTVQVAAGYEFMWFAGVRDTRNGASITNSTFGSHHDDLFFHGPFLRLTGNF
ncbi:MAG TPA: Lpg1974 family pore-forming outer membrane protein [Candidatus Cybelea sp.]|nr:Lpg1974 family pore-forming outer membrane protein [Candidatus Cybelea sp.]